MSSQTGREKRRFERVQVSSKNVFDLSEGGVFIKTLTPRRLGSIIHVEIKLEGLSKPLQANAKVIRVIHEAGATARQPAGMALQFIEPSEETLQLIREFIQQMKRQGGN